MSDELEAQVARLRRYVMGMSVGLCLALMTMAYQGWQAVRTERVLDKTDTTNSEVVSALQNSASAVIETKHSVGCHQTQMVNLHIRLGQQLSANPTRPDIWGPQWSRSFVDWAEADKKCLD